MSEFKDDKGITKLTWDQYKKQGDHLRKTKGFTAKQIKDLYGKPVIDGVVVEITTGGPNTIRQRSASSRAKSQANRKRKTGIYKNVDTLPKDIKEWAKRLTKEGKWPKGKSLQGFIDSHKGAQKKLLSDIEALKNMGFIDDETGRSLIDDGHLIAIGSEQKIGHPLRPKGTHGSHYGEARVPELSAVNQAKREAGDIDFLQAKRGGIITDDLDAFSQYLTDDAGYGPGVKPSTATKQRIAQGADPRGAMAKQIEATETVRQRRAFNPNAAGLKIGGRLGGDSSLLIRNARKIKTKTLLANALKIANNPAAKRLNGLTSATRRGETITRGVAAAATGDVVGATVAGGTLLASEALQSTAAQKAISKQIAKMAAKRGGKTALKAIPGLDVLISGKEAWDYAAQGKFDQAGIAALSGAIGWIPVIGDGASAALDFTNTGIDIARMDFNKKNKKKPNVDTNIKNRRTLTSSLKHFQ